MRPPKGFENEKYPLRHRLINAFGLSITSGTLNTAFIPIVMGSLDMASDDPETIVVNPHNTAYVEDTGPLCRQMSIIDRMTISLKFNMINCGPENETATDTFTGDDIPVFKFLWRPIFGVYPEKLDAADDDTGTTVAAILGLTKDATFEDVVPLTTTKLATAAPSELALAVSAINDVQVFGDFNMTTNTAMEEHVFDETLLHDALRRYTNKGALRSCMGRTRHVTLSRSNKPFHNVYLDKFVPRAIRRIQAYSFFGIQVHLPFQSEVDQMFLQQTPSNAVPHLGVTCIANYHEWNVEHDQSMIPPA